MVFIKTFGRTTIYANYSEQELLRAKSEVLDNIVREILTNASGIHAQNQLQSNYLKNYYYGDQDIKNKVKHTREEINNKTVENRAYAIVDFKKTYLLGKPIQYVQLNDAGEQEISKLNQYVRYENKKAKDMELYEDVLVCGRGFRYVNKDKKGNEDEAPFEIVNCPVENTEVVYSSKLGNEQLFAYIVTPMIYQYTETAENGEIVTKNQDYNIYTCYFRNKVINYSDKNGDYERIKTKIINDLGEQEEIDEIPLIWGEHTIIEYRLNKKRISLIELGKDLLDDINYLESLDKDDLEQYVNAIMVFTNAEVSEQDLTDIKKLGAVCINSTEQKKASVDLLQGKLNSTDTQIYYNRLLNALHQILAVPISSDTGTIQSGDTGKAKLTGQGFTSAGIRAEGDETMFGMSDFESLKIILSICRNTKDSGISNLKASDIDTKFQRDMSDNLLVKTQALQTLYQCDIPRKFANSIVNLFGDSNAITNEQQKLFGDQVSQQNNGSQDNPTLNEEDKVNNQNNKVTNILERNEQGQ